jgi:hypothetical protein
MIEERIAPPGQLKKPEDYRLTITAACRMTSVWLINIYYND